MTDLDTWVMECSQWCWANGWKGSLLLLIFLAVRSGLKQYLPPHYACLLWIVVAVRFLLPFPIESPYSLFALPNVITESTPASAQTDGAVGGAAADLALQPSMPDEGTTPWITAPVIGALAWGWFVGVVLIGLQAVFAIQSLNRKLLRERPSTESPLLDVLEDSKSHLALHMPISLIWTDHVSVPMLYGWIRPRIFLPRSLKSELSGHKLNHILLHELNHIRRHDILAQWGAFTIALLNWYNPLIWLALRSFRQDIEEACDAAVLRHSPTLARDDYGESLLQLASLSRTTNPQYGALAIMEHTHQLTRRILRITANMKTTTQSIILFAALFIGLGTLGLTETRAETKDEPDIKAAKEAALVWLGYFDKADYDQCYRELHPFAKEKITQEDWTNALKHVRIQVGKTQKRTFHSAERFTQLPGAPKGKHVIMIMKGQYEHAPKTTETVTCTQTQNGSWLLSGYYVK